MAPALKCSFCVATMLLLGIQTQGLTEAEDDIRPRDLTPSEKRDGRGRLASWLIAGMRPRDLLRSEKRDGEALTVSTKDQSGGLGPSPSPAAATVPCALGCNVPSPSPNTPCCLISDVFSCATRDDCRLCHGDWLNKYSEGKTPRLCTAGTMCGDVKGNDKICKAVAVNYDQSFDLSGDVTPTQIGSRSPLDCAIECGSKASCDAWAISYKADYEKERKNALPSLRDYVEGKGNSSKKAGKGECYFVSATSTELPICGANKQAKGNSAESIAWSYPKKACPPSIRGANFGVFELPASTCANYQPDMRKRYPNNEQLWNPGQCCALCAGSSCCSSWTYDTSSNNCALFNGKPDVQRVDAKGVPQPPFTAGLQSKTHVSGYSVPKKPTKTGKCGKKQTIVGGSSSR